MRDSNDWRKMWVILLLVMLPGLTACSGEPSPRLTVSAAANLIPAFEDIGRTFEAGTGVEVVFNFGSSGKLAQQIEQGAPVDVFVSANEAYVARLAEGGFVEPDSVRVYALGRLAAWSRRPDLLPLTVSDLSSPRVERIAIANPEHAPYGVVAKAVLQNAHLWDQLQPKLVTGNDVRQTLTYAQSGDVAVALVPLSLVVNLDEGAYDLIPETYHPPIAQALGIVSQTSHREDAQRFVDFILSQAGQAILQKYGYEAIGD